MKVITLWQPWASAIALGLKTYETRSWPTKYTGPLAIHAAKRSCKLNELTVLRHQMYEYGYKKEYRLIEEEIKNPNNYGSIVCVCNLSACYKMVYAYSSGRNQGQKTSIMTSDVSNIERCLGHWEKDRYAWYLTDVKPIEPLPLTGKQGLTDLPEEYVSQLKFL